MHFLRLSFKQLTEIWFPLEIGGLFQTDHLGVSTTGVHYREISFRHFKILLFST